MFTIPQFKAVPYKETDNQEHHCFVKFKIVKNGVNMI